MPYTLQHNTGKTLVSILKQLQKKHMQGVTRFLPCTITTKLTCAVLLFLHRFPTQITIKPPAGVC